MYRPLSWKECVTVFMLMQASLDEPSASVMMHRTEPTRLQSLALQLSEKVSSLVETNERMMEMKQGTYFYQSKIQQNRQGMLLQT